MKKASYRLLQWTMLMGSAAILATACVVTSGDGDNDGEGGEGGTSSTAGTSSSEAGEGGTSTAGTTSGGSSGSGTSGSAGSGTSGSGGSGGSGGSAPAYVPGVCQGGDEPTMLPACTPTANDEGEACTICIKAQCCTEWKTCYGDTPTNACGWGETEDDFGQFDCIQNCYMDGLATATDLDQLQRDCADQCLNQCEDKPDDMGFVTDVTLALQDCANEKCLNDCFPAE